MREEENNRQSSKEKKSFDVKRFMRKRWIIPAVYLGAVAIVLSAFLFMQNNQDGTALPEDAEDHITDGIVYDEEAVPVTSANEVIKMPVTDENEVDIVGYFYDYDASPEEQQAALVYYNNTYYQNKGIDLAMESGESFEVTAALSGTVVKAEEDSLLGYVVQINHDNGVVTHYQSLESVNVEEGATVKQGDLIGLAGRNLYNSEAGVHLHFEIRYNGDALNPMLYLNQPIASIFDEAHQIDEDIASADDEKEVEEDEDKGEDKDADESKDEDQSE